ncbi:MULTISPECIES: glycosyltransferase [unclassified Streptococcus]|uniref:glycosyltransferase n=1 Tax=unclassified Streptococcus TaxID=2608887 RepID=UPI00107227E2|nr:MULTISPECIES: glycosyltransferase [unclassified Streptococcus]MBF0806143.1 glycosyltransferase [Streptococcus sp. 19428wA2_WM07]TFU28255.1 glycosyltransferase [Streptococcus sp. WM07]
MTSVCALVVTYNRSIYLRKALSGILHQDKKVSGVLIFNNDATDTTEKDLIEEGYLKEQEYRSNELYHSNYNDVEIYYYRNHENAGGAGGFSKGIELVSALDYDYVWIMDDDVYPEPDCLSETMKQMQLNQVSIGIPNRTDENFDDEPCIALDLEDYRKFWTGLRKTKLLGPFTEDAIFVVDLPFEGPVVEMNLLRKVGVPDSGYFLLYDDTDYAMRLQEYSNIIFATRAQLHRQLAKKTAATGVTEPFTWREYYGMRNNIIFDKRHGKNWKVRHLSPLLILAQRIRNSIITGHLRQNFPIIRKAFIDGIFQRMGKRVDPNY